MPFAYVLYSKKLNRFYIGSTSDTLELRIEKHFNKSYGNKAFTAKTDDWRLHWSVFSDSFKHVQNIETKLKAMKSKIYLQNLLKYPELTDKIFLESR